MRCFLKFFLIILFGQITLLAITLAIEPIRWIGETVQYIFYLVPIILLFGDNSGMKKEISLFFLIGFPIIFYSILISFSICMLSKLKNNRDNKTV